ncbi:hypothetical protein GAY31_13790 [Azospirillum brasilense]|nr:hypothetical protein [Azospirillum brasilense]
MEAVVVSHLSEDDPDIPDIEKKFITEILREKAASLLSGGFKITEFDPSTGYSTITFRYPDKVVTVRSRVREDVVENEKIYEWHVGRFLAHFILKANTGATPYNAPVPYTVVLLGILRAS